MRPRWPCCTGLTPAVTKSAGVIMLTTCMFGWSNGNMNSSGPAIRAALGLSHAERPERSDAIWGLCVSIFCAGAMLGCSQSARLADRLGRKRFLSLSALCFIAGASLQTGAVLGGELGALCLLAGRAVSGAASGGATVVVPTYMNEIAPLHLRGSLGVTFQLGITASMLLAQVSGMLASEGWWLIIALPALLGALQLALMPLLLESPAWLAHVGRCGEAEHVRLMLDGTTSAQASRAGYAGLHEIAPSVSSEKFDLHLHALAAEAAEGALDGFAKPPAPPQSSVRALVADGRLRPLLLLSVALLVTQQLSGINVAFNYSVTYLRRRGISNRWVDAVTVGINAANVGSSLLAAWLIDRSGRRRLLLASTGSMVCCVVLITHGMATLPAEAAVREAAVGIIAFVFCYGVGMGPIPWIAPAELFDQTHRATALGVATLCSWAANGLVALAFLPLAAALGPWAFVPFALILAAFSAYAASAMPETRVIEPDASALDDRCSGSDGE